MNIELPQAYLIGLIGLLAGISILVGRQLLKVRRDEINLIKLEKGDASNSKVASQLYELASVQIRKRLYPQATSTLQKALKQLKEEPDEAKAVIENALGFSLAAQSNFKAAITHYRSAIKAKANYPVAMNNLAFAQERLSQTQEAIDIYSQVLELDPENKTARKQLKKLKQTKNDKSPEVSNDGGGF